MNINKTDYSKNKCVVLSGENMKEIDSLLLSPLLRDRMPERVRGKRAKMVLWAVKELDKVLREGIKEQQTYLDFDKEGA